MDGYGCTTNSYKNLTTFLNPLIDTLDDETLAKDLRLAAPLILKEDKFRKLLSKDFSEENPDSNIMASVFEITNEPIITEIRDGKEVLVEKITDQQGFYEFAERAFKLSQEWDSENLDIIAFS